MCFGCCFGCRCCCVCDSKVIENEMEFVLFVLGVRFWCFCSVLLTRIFCRFTTVFEHGNCGCAGSAAKWLAVKCRVASTFMTLSHPGMVMCIGARACYMRHLLFICRAFCTHLRVSARARIHTAAHALCSRSLCLAYLRQLHRTLAERLDFEFHGPR